MDASGERVGGPFGEPEPASIGDGLAGGSLDHRRYFARLEAAVARGERSVAVVDERARDERAVRRHPWSALAECGLVEGVGQADGLRLVGRVDGDELADLAHAAEAPVQRVEQGGGASHLEGARGSVADEHVEGHGEHALGRARTGRHVQLPTLAG